MPPLDRLSGNLLARAQTRFGRAKAYRAVFSGPDAETVLRDIFQFCHVAAPVVVPGDALSTGVNDGMRRVALRIAKLSNMSEGEMLRLALDTETDNGGDHAG